MPAGLPRASGFALQAIFSPKASLVFSPVPTTDFFLNAGTSFHSNDARAVVIDRRVAELVRAFRGEGLDDAEIDERLAELNFDPEHEVAETLPRAVGAELGFRVRPLRTLNIAVAAWKFDLEREFVYLGDDGFTELSGRSSRHGLDAEARLGTYLLALCGRRPRPVWRYLSRRAPGRERNPAGSPAHLDRWDLGAAPGWV